jgi:hypothetical protein
MHAGVDEKAREIGGFGDTFRDPGRLYREEKAMGEKRAGNGDPR